jgi:hypothetical protein
LLQSSFRNSIEFYYNLIVILCIMYDVMTGFFIMSCLCILTMDYDYDYDIALGLSLKTYDCIALFCDIVPPSVTRSSR